MKRKKGDVNLTLFFTRRASLKTWAKVGNLDREIALYKKLSEVLKEVSFVTYGGKKDKEYSKRLNSIKLLPVQYHERVFNTILELLLKYYPEIRRTNVLKTNQIKGAEIPILVKKSFGKKLIVRCGYLHSYFIKKKTTNNKEIKDAERLEKQAFTSADLIMITSEWQKGIIMKNYNIDTNKIKVIPNYVVTDFFKPDLGSSKDFDLIYVGRLDEQKNLKNLLKALHYLKKRNKNISLLIIGGNDGNKKLREMVNQYSLNVTFKNNISNFKLPIFLNKAKIFVLPSKYEGHPKTLIEAMSCGLPCIGGNVPGIKQDIKHLETGYLCNIEYKDIAEAINVVLSDKSLSLNMGENARDYVLSKYSLNRVFKLELAAIREVLDK